MNNEEKEILLHGINPDKNIIALETDKGKIFKFIRKGNRVIKSVDTFRPFMYIKEDLSIPFEYKSKIDVYNLEGNNVFNKIIYFNNIFDFFKFRKAVRHQEGKFYGISNITEMYMCEHGYTMFKGMDYNDLKIMAIDIETDGLSFVWVDENGIEIGENDSRDTIKYKKFNCKLEMIGISTNYGYETVLHGTEEDQLLNLVKVIRTEDPDLLVFYNGFAFDLNVIYFKARDLGIPLNVGRGGCDRHLYSYTSNVKLGNITDNRQMKFGIFGRHCIDLYYSAKKYDETFRVFGNDFSLKGITKDLGFERENRVHISGPDIQRMLVEDFEKVKDYCLDDCRDTIKLAEFLLPVEFYLTKMVPTSFERLCMMGNVHKVTLLMLRAYYIYNNSIPEAEENRHFEGGISACFEKGVHKNILHLDVSSMYPSIMINYKVQPPTDELNIFLTLLEYMTNDRLEAKKTLKKTKKDTLEYDKLDGYQNALKICINAMYGCLSTAFFIWNYLDGGEFITRKGREILTKMMNTIKECGGETVQADTDGIYVQIRDFQKWNETIGRKEGEVVPKYE